MRQGEVDNVEYLCLILQRGRGRRTDRQAAERQTDRDSDDVMTREGDGMRGSIAIWTERKNGKGNGEGRKRDIMTQCTVGNQSYWSRLLGGTRRALIRVGARSEKQCGHEE